ncbi:hypothetical protein J0H58_00710 [bacterium]|nr:hypothetical protein [bacterium]
MAKAFPLDLLSGDGTVVPATAHVSTTPIPGSIWRDFTVRVAWAGGEAVGTGCDAFYALRAARAQLDPVGLLPRCYGACRNFVMSGMGSQMGGGGAGHLVTLGHPAGAATAMTFEAGPDMDVVSVAAQDAFKEAWLTSLGLSPNPARLQTPPHGSLLGWLKSLVRRRG